ncbi:MAG: diguanylate cyclase [Bacteroidetes bacterium]|nr:MAG: diguanylate cyclase [Bacteroidota bacterium]
MNLSTNYLGLQLKNPIVVSSSRMTGDLESIKKCIDAGAGAIVLKSLFEEQLRIKTQSTMDGSRASEMYFWFPEAKNLVMEQGIKANMEQYLSFVYKVKENSSVPIIASINCQTPNEWPHFAAAIQEAGADALELNIAIFPFNNSMASCELEEVYIQILNQVKKHVSIPVSIKLGHYFTNLCALAHRLVENKADGLVLFNRYFRPDIDIDSMKVVEDNYFSSSEELPESLRWIALMAENNLGCDLAASSGIHSYVGVVKQLLAGADVTQICSTLYLNGIDYLTEIIHGLESWMMSHNFETIKDFKGKSLNKQTMDASFERVHFMNRNFD